MQYVPNLERLLVFRLLEQLSAVYTTIEIPHFKRLIADLTLKFYDGSLVLILPPRHGQFFELSALQLRS